MPGLKLVPPSEFKIPVYHGKYVFEGPDNTTTDEWAGMERHRHNISNETIILLIIYICVYIYISRNH